MIKIKLINISKTPTSVDDGGGKTNQSTKIFTTIWAKEIETSISEHYEVVKAGKYSKTRQLLINDFEYETQEKVEIENVSLDIIRVKKSYKNPHKLLLVVAE